MDIIIFLYNIALILLYGAAMVYCFTLFRLKKSPSSLYLTILFLFYIFDNTVIYMTEFLHDFSVRYDASFMSVPAFKTVIVIVTSFCLLNANNRFLKKALSIADYLVLVTLALWDLFVPLLPDSAWMVWLYYLPYQLFTLYLSVVSLNGLKHDKKITEEVPFLKEYKKILRCTFLFSFLIVLEDTIVIFHFDIYRSLSVKINNRSMTEDILSIIYAIFFIYHFAKELMPSISQNTASALSKQPENIVLSPETTPSTGASRDFVSDTEFPATKKEPLPVEDDSFYRFSKHHALTTREQDILRYMLKNKNNQDISDLLYISIGTVKTHIHNIYQKANVTRRNRLIAYYENWCDSAADPSQE